MPDSTLVDSVTNVGAMGLLAVICVTVLYYIPKAIAAYSDSKKDDRDQINLLMEGIKQDRHADRNATHENYLAHQIEAREQRETFQAEMKAQRQHDEAKWERLVGIVNQNQQGTIEALHRLEESNRIIAEAVKSTKKTG